MRQKCTGQPDDNEIAILEAQYPGGLPGNFASDADAQAFAQEVASMYGQDDSDLSDSNYDEEQAILQAAGATTVSDATTVYGPTQEGDTSGITTGPTQEGDTSGITTGQLKIKRATPLA